ncbi:MAG: 16S rRNA (cytosine(1402)-N(4))-methyltransferase RsmH [Spirochaetales bacterium]|nr:16S rRNA (cytosine(1402)-N(4))-methyltransferase RsmH [Spirochaetales bacterium]
MVETVHYSVLQNEVFALLSPAAGNGLFIDCTLGEGGHTGYFLTQLPQCRAAGIDADGAIMKIARERLSSFAGRVSYHNSWFNRFFREYPEDLDRPSAILIDLGISIFHYQKSGRGFSFQKDEALDMRLDPGLEASAADLVNTWPQNELADIIYLYGEERYSRRIAKAIVEQRKTGDISTSAELAEIIWNAVPAQYRHGRIHPATRSFQALRIAVNGELDRLREVLSLALAKLLPGGRFGVISFHSLEDRIVKHFFREKARDCVCPPEQPRCTCGGKALVRIITGKPVTAGDEELAINPPSRSAKLRVIEKLREEL